MGTALSAIPWLVSLATEMPPAAADPGNAVSRSLAASEKGLCAERVEHHEGVGVDLVQRLVNEILAAGCDPVALSFGLSVPDDLDTEVGEALVLGLFRGCRAHDLSLSHHEVSTGSPLALTATLFGRSADCSFTNVSALRAGDVLFGLSSSGLHSTGHRLATGWLQTAGLGLASDVPGGHTTFGCALRALHKCYLGVLHAPRKEAWLHGLAPVDDGGLEGSLQRFLPSDLDVRVDPGSWPVPPLFAALRDAAGCDDATMRNTFNMGIGMVVAVASEGARAFDRTATMWNEPHWQIGVLVPGSGRVLW